MSSTTATATDEANATTNNKNHKKYRRDKPWDNETIDHWKIDSWNSSSAGDSGKGGNDDESNKGTAKDVLPGGHLLEESSFATLFPKYKEYYLKQNWSLISKTFDTYGIACILNLIEGSMTVKTTKRTSDPYAIIKARDCIKLLARSIPVQQALQIMKDEYICDIIKIGTMVRNKERFIKRRQRILGHDGSTLKSLEIITGCYILVQGNTVSVMGTTITGLKQVRRVIEDCMYNVQHPIYHLKRFMIERELRNDPTLQKEDWNRFLPQFTKKNVQRKKTKTTDSKKKKSYTPFPPPQLPSKIDMQLDSGEYFLPKEYNEKKKLQEKKVEAKVTSQKKRQLYNEQTTTTTTASTTSEKNHNSNDKANKKQKVDNNTNDDIITTKELAKRIQKNLQNHQNIATNNPKQQQNSPNKSISDYIVE